jgi:transposase, IS5 family
MIDRVVPFESFRAEIEAAVRTPADEQWPQADRRDRDVSDVGSAIALQSFSGEQIDYQVRDRLSFTRFSAARLRGRHSGRHDAGLFRESWQRLA